ncbi:MAG: replication-associated recombination protein A [Bacteroidia bacterium]|nr:replication-associated recombination protein A [Bacteroidia bacterium]MCZ2247607.1 replication-associated recombination protein A [Bacteroidia bacterium]
MTNKNIPLAEYLRPKTLEHYIGQTHLVGVGAILRNIIEGGQIHSMILWGPPGVGKTTLAGLFAQKQERDFFTLSAVNSGVKEVREVIEKAQKQLSFSGKSPILFIDEIHRFSKSQQDSLLNAVEKGIVILIGATTENPSFEVIAPLLSRCQLYVLKSLTQEELLLLLQQAIQSDYFEGKKINLSETDALINISGGDARKLLGALEIVINSVNDTEVTITNELVKTKIQQRILIYDKQGENHYDIISAFIKSLRGSDPNAAVYWLARMIESGEDLLFIARRMIILASEDIGNANPTALVMAVNCFDAVNKIGYPESRIILSQTAIYLASSPKSNASYLAIEDALKLVQLTGNLPVPLHLRNAPTKMMKDIDYGKGYEYAHHYENSFVNLEFMPDQLSHRKIYEPGKNVRENEIRNYLKRCWNDKYNY